MAVKNFFIAAGQDGNFGALVDGVAQTAASRTDGWTVAKIASGNSCEYDSGTKQASGSFTSQTTTPKPASFLTGTTANAFKTPAPLTGTFAAGNWILALEVIATTQSSQAGRIRIRVFKSVNASGASAVELTSATQVGNTVTVTTATTNIFSQVIWAPGVSIALNNEYLFFVLAWEITTASGNNSGDVVLRTGSAAGVSVFQTTDFALTKAITPANISGQSTVGGNVMGFPFPQLPVIDTFTDPSAPQALETYDPVNWQTDVFANGSLGTNADGKVYPFSVSVGSNVRKTAFADGESYMTVPTIPGAGNYNVWPIIRAINPNDSVNYDYYYLYVSNSTSSIRLARVKAGDLVSFPQVFSAGDSLGLAARGTRIFAFYKPGAGSWQLLGAFTDSTLASGFPGMTLDSACAVDNFGGGSYPSAKPITPANIAAISSVSCSAPIIFPTTPVIDLFNRADGPIGPNYQSANSSIGVVDNIASNQVSPTGGQNWGTVTKTVYPATQEEYFTVANVGAYIEIDAYARWIPDANGGSGYYGSVQSGVWKLNRYDSGTWTLLATGLTQALSNGDGIGMQLIGNTITLFWRNGLTGPWTPMCRTVDSTYSGPGCIGWYGSDGVGVLLDNFGGGLYRSKLVAPTANITGQSSVGGAITRVHPVPLPAATISAASTVSGSVRALRKVAPANIAGQSTVSGNVRALRKVTPAQVNGLSTVSGSIRALRRVQGANIAGASTVTGDIIVRIAVRPTTSIAGLSTVSGALTKLSGGPKPIAPATIAGVSTVSGKIGFGRRVTANIAATSTVGATVRTGFFPGSLTGLGVWLDASQLALADGADVSPWGNIANPAVPGSILNTPNPTFRANQLNGKPVVRFLAGQGRLRMNGTGVSSPFTLLYVGHMTSTSPTTAQRIGNVVYVSPTVGNLVLGWWGSGTVSYQDALFDGAWASGDPSTPVTTDWKLYSFDKTGANPVRMFSNGTFLKNGGSGSMDLNGSFAISGYDAPTADESSDCEVAEVVIYNRVLSDTERQQVEGYLRSKWLPGAKVISPANINAVSTVGGNVGVRRAVLPNQINAVSTVSGNVGIRRAVLPAQINGASTVSGSIRVRRAVLPANIAGSSTVSGVLVVRRGIVSGQINAFSTVSGAVRVLRAVRPLTISGLSAVSGSVIRRAAVVGQINGLSTVSGSIRPLRAILPTQIAGVSTVAGKVIAFHRISGLINGVSTLSGSVATHPVKIISGALVSGASTVSGSVRALHRISGLIAGQSTVSAGLVSPKRVITGAQINAASTVSGSVAKRFLVRPLTITASSTVSGAIGRRYFLTIGNVTSVSTVSGALTKIGALRPILPAQIAGVSTVSGSIRRLRPIVTVTIAGVSTVSGRVVTRHVITGQIASVSTLSGALRRRVTISGQISAVSTVSGALHPARGLWGGHIDAISSVSAKVTITGSIGTAGDEHDILSAGVPMSQDILSTVGAGGSMLSAGEPINHDATSTANMGGSILSAETGSGHVLST